MKKPESERKKTDQLGSLKRTPFLTLALIAALTATTTAKVAHAGCGYFMPRDEPIRILPTRIEGRSEIELPRGSDPRNCTRKEIERIAGEHTVIYVGAMIEETKKSLESTVVPPVNLERCKKGKYNSRFEEDACGWREKVREALSMWFEESGWEKAKPVEW